MNTRFTVVESNLNRVEFRWKWLQFLKLSFILGMVTALIVLGIGVAMSLGHIANRGLAVSLFAGLTILAFIAWAVIMICVAAGAPERSDFAAELERAEPRLMDRLHTVLHLTREGMTSRDQTFARRIASQIQHLFAKQAAPTVYSGTRPLPWLGAMILCAGLTIFYYQHFSPWQAMLEAQRLAAEKLAAAQLDKVEKPQDLAVPAENTVEQNQAWGEVRITEPATDMKVTKVDVVPLQIEAAANQALAEVGWTTSINGEKEQGHPLPPPPEPRYAVYQPSIYLDEMQLADWDVMTYYAKASTEKRDNYASEVYFLEVRPFREDILKLPGGEGGQAYQCLSELTSLINRQQHVIRQTHQFAQKPPEQPNLQQQDRAKLADAERDLSQAAKHLYAKLAVEMENKPIGEALDNLAKAEKTLAQAGDLLTKDSMPEAQSRERGALSELVAARKMFQKAVSDNPDAFEEPKPEDEASPIADAKGALKEMAEFRDEAKAAREFVRQTQEKQKQLQQKARTETRGNYPRLGAEEKQLQESLENFQAQHPQVFKDAKEEAQEANQAMSQAAQSLERRAADIRANLDKATKELDELGQAMDQQASSRELADAYKLRQMLDDQIKELDKTARQEPGSSGQKAQQAASQAKQTVNEMRRMAEQESTRDAFGDPLREALSGQNKQRLDGQLVRMEQAQSQPDQQAAAGPARDGLKQVGQAFDNSAPKALQAARQKDALKGNEQDPFAQGMAELESLIKRLEEQKPLSKEDQAKQGQQALYNLQTGLRNEKGSNEKANQILLQLEKALKDQPPPEVSNLRQLLDQLHRFSVELANREEVRTNEAQVVNIDPSRLPPAYRGRIQKYFQKLSEK